MNVWYGVAFTIAGLYSTYLAYGKAVRFDRSKT
jgi:hypothetical protein